MASIGNDPNGRKRILFVAADGSRRTVRLGKCSPRDAEAVCRHVEALANATMSGQPVSRETAAWLGGVGDMLHDRLARAGLVEARESPGRVRLAEFIDGYIAQRVDLKPATRTLLQQARVWLVRFLGEGRRLEDVTSADADGYRAHMVESGLAKATVAKRCRYARHFFEVAKRRRLVADNPFGHISGAVKGDPAKRRFIPAEDVQRVIDTAPDPQWKLLLALARWGGLRIPSEALALTWADVDFARGRFLVRAAKTEHHDDGGVRVVPMFPELVPHFQAVFDAAPEGAQHVITRYRSRAANLRTQLVRYIEQAGLTPWPKPWQNLRATRATELADAFPSHVCAAWLGHTEAVADAFYRQLTDDHFARAQAGAAQYPAQHLPQSRRTESNAAGAEKRNRPVLADDYAMCSPVLNGGLGPAGFEPATQGL